VLWSVLDPSLTNLLALELSNSLVTNEDSKQLDIKKASHGSIYLWLYIPLLGPGHFFQFLDLYTVSNRLCGLVVKSFWLQIQRSRVRFPALLDFLRSRGLERGPCSLLRTIEELLE
jgi:hypothetical protein